MPKRFLQLVLFFCLMAGSVPIALADYYRYTDAGGAVNITNKLDTVPEKYRSSVKVIRDETLSKQDPGARKQQPEATPEESGLAKETAAPATAAVPAAAPQGKLAELSARFIWFKPLLFLGAILAAFLVVIKISSLVPPGPLSKLIYLTYFFGVGVFLYQAYIEHVVADSLAVKEKAVNMMKKSSQRELPLSEEAPPAGQK